MILKPLQLFLTWVPAISQCGKLLELSPIGKYHHLAAIQSNHIISNDRFELKCDIPHPFFPEERLNFIADVPHLLKNLRTSFLKHNISIPQFAMNKYQLSSDKVRYNFFVSMPLIIKDMNKMIHTYRK